MEMPVLPVPILTKGLPYADSQSRRRQRWRKLPARHGGADLIYGFDPNGPQSQASEIIATRVAAGLGQPLFVVAPPDDPNRLFIVEKTGLIKILDLATGQVLATPFLNVSSQILTDGERGRLGLAFDPAFASNGLFYLNLINMSGDTEIRRYHVSANPNVAEPASTPILTIDQPSFSNHKGGWIGFGPDGYLYAALGDGGSGGDPLGSGQNINSLLGKILRVDVHGDDFPVDPTRNYAVPADNPFVGSDGLDEIFAFGLRNPWRPSFDRGLGDFYIADVGQGQWEEIDIGQSSANYGWNTFEGPVPFPGGAPLTGVSALRQSTPTTIASDNRLRAAMSIAAKGKRCRGSISSPTSSKGRCSRCALMAVRGSPPSELRKSLPMSAR